MATFFSQLPRQCAYFCLASQMALLGLLFFIEREKISLKNSYHLMPRPGFELTSVETYTTIRGTIQDRFTD